MTDWLATHAVLVPSLALPLIKHGRDAAALARSEADLGLMVDAMRETLDGLPAVGKRIVPRSTFLMRSMPRFLLIAALCMVIPAKFMEVGGVWHVTQGLDEMNQLAVELGALVEKSGLPVPALRELLGMEIPETLRAVK